MGYQGLVVGERDVSAGVPFLTSTAAEVGLPLLSANLADASGKPLFKGHLAFKDGPLEICAVAVSPEGSYGAEVRRQDPVAAAKRELAALAPEHCQVKLLLAHLSRRDLELLLGAVPGFDVAAVAHDGWQSEPQPIAGIPVVSEGQRGRVVARLDLASATSDGPFVDLGAETRLENEGKRIDDQIKDLQGRLPGAPAALVQNDAIRLKALEKRRADLAKIHSSAKSHPRTLRLSFTTLDTAVKDDPTLLARVTAYQAKYPEPAPALPVAFHPASRPAGPPTTAPAGGDHALPFHASGEARPTSPAKSVAPQPR